MESSEERKRRERDGRSGKKEVKLWNKGLNQARRGKREEGRRKVI